MFSHIQSYLVIYGHIWSYSVTFSHIQSYSVIFSHILILVMVMMGMNVEGQCRLCFAHIIFVLANVVFAKLAIGWGWVVLAEHKEWLGIAIQ